jgi:hypothetical protein
MIGILLKFQANEEEKGIEKSRTKGEKNGSGERGERIDWGSGLRGGNANYTEARMLSIEP